MEDDESMLEAERSPLEDLVHRFNPRALLLGGRSNGGVIISTRVLAPPIRSQ